MKEPNMSTEELAEKIIRNKPYFRRNSGGVTFSGGEPLLQSKFIIETAKILKAENIHIALDTAGVGLGDYDEVLEYVDLVLFDVKHITEEGYKNLVGRDISESKKFVEALNRSGKPVWIRQVIVPGIHDNDEYLNGLLEVLKSIKNIERIDFLPYHKMGDEKYEKMGLENPFKERIAMDKQKCTELHEKFIKMWEETK